MGSKDQGQRGAAAVEFALLAPIFVALLFAIVEFGLIIYTNSMLAHASREGARFGVVFTTPRRTSGEIQAVVQNFLNRCALTSTANVAVLGAGGAGGSSLEVRVTYNYQFFVLSRIINTIPIFGGTMPNTLLLNADTVMRLE